MDVGVAMGLRPLFFIFDRERRFNREYSIKIIAKTGRVIVLHNLHRKNLHFIPCLVHLS
jgi:hypothetical protein